MRILIGGGTGFIGKALTNVLKTKGHEVTCIGRLRGEDKCSWDDIKNDGLPVCDAVVNLAGENILNPMKRWGNHSFRQEVLNSRIITTQILVDAIKKAPLKPHTWVSSSAIGYYPYSEVEEYTEDYVNISPSNFQSSLCKQWEMCSLLDSCVGVRHVIIRIGIVLGKQGGAVQNMMLPFRLGLGGPIGSGDQYTNWIHIDDAAGIFAYSIENSRVDGVMNAVAPAINTNKEFAKAFAGALNRPAVLPTPAFAMNIVFGPERAEMLLKGQKVIPKRTLDSGYQFKFTDLRSAMKNIVG